MDLEDLSETIYLLVFIAALLLLHLFGLIDWRLLFTTGLVDVGAVVALTYWLTRRADKEKIKAEQESKQSDIFVSKLANAIQAWQNLLPEISLTESTLNPNRFDKFDISFIKEIENGYYFKDILIQYSFLKEIWNDFTLSYNIYNEKRQGLFDSMRNDITQKIKGLNIEDGFIISIFNEVVFEAEGKNKEYDYFWNKINIGNDTIITYLKYCEIFKTKIIDKTNDHRFRTETCSNLIQTNEPITIENIHKELIRECKKRYVKQSKELIEAKNKLYKSKNVLSAHLEKNLQLLFIKKIDIDLIKRKEKDDSLPEPPKPLTNNSYEPIGMR
ncbi:Uncharacterised protein [uncultured archaeon]|nr:Uncharacterised protein [uncultured archaeon]